MTASQIVNLPVVSQSFPERPESLISRENILETIDEIFESGNEVVVIEGVEGIGKTTILMQFALRHPMNAFSLFVRGTSRMAYDPQALKYDLCNQLNWLINGRTFASLDEIGEETIRLLLMSLQRRAKDKRESYYFVVDGLEEIPEVGTQARDLILGLLPFGIPRSRFLFSGDIGRLRVSLPQSLNIKPYQLSRFSLDDTLKYLSDIVPDRQAIEEIHKTLQRLPAYLASARRALKAGLDLLSFLENMASRIPDPFEIEWRNAGLESQDHKLLLALIAFSQKQLTLRELSEISHLEESRVEQLLRNVSFVAIASTADGVAYVSDTFRKYASTQLEMMKRHAMNLLIDHMLQRVEVYDSFVVLADYLKSTGRLTELLQYLSPEHFEKILEASQSFGQLRQKLELGVTAALELRRDADMIRFAVQLSTISELEGVDIWRSEIEACMALKDYDAAIALAQSAVAKEDRLHLLAVIAKSRYEQDTQPDAVLVEQIRNLYDQIDVSALRNQRAIDIASDLIYVDTSLAIELIERVAKAHKDENAMDWAFAGLSFAALGANTEKQRPYIDVFEKLRARIADPRAQKITSTVSLLIGNYSAEQVVSEVGKLESTSERLLLLRLWILRNREKRDAVDVVEYALRQVVGATNYSPSARDFRELATPLPLLGDEDKCRKLVGSFDSQKDSVEKIGPTEDYVRLQLILARTESKYDLDAARNRIVDIYFYVRELEDISIRSQCMARLVASLHEIDSQNTIDEREGISQVSEAELAADIDRLLLETAEHFHLVRGTISALARTDPSRALDLCRRLNTEGRRNQAVFELARASIDRPLAEIDLGFVLTCIDSIKNDPDLTDAAVVETLERFAGAHEEISKELLRSLMPVVASIRNIQSAGRRCQACCLAYQLVCSRADEHIGLVENLLNQLSRSWDALDVGWYKIDVGFRITQELAGCAPDTAREYVSKAEDLRNEITLDADTAAEAYLSNLSLAIRSFGGLLPKGIDTSDDVERLHMLIDRVPSNGERAKLWAQIALQYFANKRSDNGVDTVKNHVRPLLEMVSTDDLGYRGDVLVELSPALYLAHRALAVEDISKLPWPRKEEAYAQVASFILRKVPSSESYSYIAGQGYAITYEEAVDLCSLLEQIEFDVSIYWIIESISDSVVSRSKNLLTRNQKAALADRLTRIIEQKLPAPSKRFILHDGYKIAAKAKVGQFQNTKPEFWNDLIQSARSVPNVSDRALVLAIVAASMPSAGKGAETRKRVIKDVVDNIRQIPAALDQIERYEEVASLAIGIDTPLAKSCVEQGMKLTSQQSGPNAYSAQKAFIDLAHTIDKNFAASLASLIDDDPARAEMRDSARAHYQTLLLKSDIANSLSREHDTSLASKAEFPKAAAMLLGSLNAGRLATFDTDYMRNFTEAAASLPLSDSYPIMNWLVANAKARFSETDQARTYIRPMFESLVMGAEMAERMALRSQAKLKKAKRYRVERVDAQKTEITIGPGERDLAVRTIKEWLENNVHDTLRICDEYFGPEDLGILQLLSSVKPKCQVHILTSKKHHLDKALELPWDEAYRKYWQVYVSSDQVPPETEIVVVGNSTNKSPIHDRYWLSEVSGLRFGTSLNSLGITQISSIVTMSAQSVNEKHKELDQYLLHRKREDNRGDRLNYVAFTL